MNEKIFSFAIETAIEKAREYFIQTCGLKFDNNKHVRMMEDAEAVLKQGIQDVHMQALTSQFRGNVLNDDRMILDDVVFQCNAFSRLEHGKVLAVYPYILSVGEVSTVSDSIANQLFADIWGTSFVDTARDLLQEELEKEMMQELNREGFVLSSSFGPGFYGMDVTMMKNFFEVLDGSKIGVNLRGNSLLVPLKSCAGFFVAVEGEWVLPPRDCQNCLGNSGGCRFCKNNPQRVAQSKMV